MSWYNFQGPVQGGDLPDDDERRRRRLHHADAGASFAMGDVPGKGPQHAGQQQMVLEQAPGGAAVIKPLSRRELTSRSMTYNNRTPQQQ